MPQRVKIFRKIGTNLTRIFERQKVDILKLLKLIQPSQNSLYNYRDSRRIKLSTRLRLGLSHLSDHQFEHRFQVTLNVKCNYSGDIKPTS